MESNTSPARSKGRKPGLYLDDCLELYIPVVIGIVCTGLSVGILLFVAPMQYLWVGHERDLTRWLVTSAWLLAVGGLLIIVSRWIFKKWYTREEK